MKILLFILLGILFSSICTADSNTENINTSKQIVGKSLEKLKYVESLANKSNKFHEYCWSNYNELDGCFRMSSIMLVGYDSNKKRLAYLQKVEAQAEDAGNIYRLKVQSLNDNKILLNKKFHYNVDSSEYEDVRLFDIEYFYKNKENEIKTILREYDIQSSVFSFKYLPYSKNGNSFSLGFSTTKKMVEFGYNPPKEVIVLNNLIIKKKNKLFFKQNYSNNSFCNECIYPFFLLEPLSVIELGASGQRVLVVGLLAYDFHGPNTLFFQLIGI